MIRKKNDRHVEVKPSPFNGVGEITVRSLLNGPEEMYEKGRVFAHTTLMPGCAIGYHVHQNDSETYYILNGVADYDDNGTKVQLFPGDVAYTPEGCGHGIANNGTEPVDFIALILYS